MTRSIHHPADLRAPRLNVIESWVHFLERYPHLPPIDRKTVAGTLRVLLAHDPRKSA